MSYPPSSPGYPSAPQPTSPYGAPQQPSRPTASAAPAGESPLPTYLLAAVAGLGVVTYVLSFALDAKDGVGLNVTLALTAGLLAGVGVLPKQKNIAGVAAVLSAVAFLLTLSAVVAAGDGGWALYVVLGLTLVQTGVAVWALLLQSGVIAPPVPKPQFEAQVPQYGQYGGPSQYYGQQSQPQHGGQPYQQAPPQQRSSYPSQYGSYSGGPNTGGFSVQSQQGGPQGSHSSSATPPTGFPAFGQPQQQPSSSSSNASAPTTQVPTQQPTQPSSSQQSGPSQS